MKFPNFLYRVFAALMIVCLPDFAGGAAQAAPRFCVRRGTTHIGNHIQISGILFTQLDYGPPNYGENPKTDSKEDHIILRLDDRLRVDRKDDVFGTMPAEITVTEIQVAFVETDPKFAHQHFRNRHAVISGELYAAETAHHVRSILISASDIRDGGRIGCDGKEAPPQK
jgi:hypothetical protein